MDEPVYAYEKTFEIKAEDFSLAGMCSSHIKRLLKQRGISADRIRNVCIAAYEAEINMIIHSQGGEVFFGITDGYIDIICRDNGPGITDIGLAMSEGYSTASVRAREMGFGAGMGLANISKNTDEFDIKSSPAGTTMKMRFNLK